ncbi:hypothetical protein [Actinokineospora enzanensis]|uniref:hypothetical protein n=1 Tax=Actinokineospora enzanensis TaxID=155975 RepID=UPI00036AB714|nr:hypothetical protein [Actinokineospora enzanensis]
MSQPPYRRDPRDPRARDPQQGRPDQGGGEPRQYGHTRPYEAPYGEQGEHGDYRENPYGQDAYDPYGQGQYNQGQYRQDPYGGQQGQYGTDPRAAGQCNRGPDRGSEQYSRAPEQYGQPGRGSEPYRPEPERPRAAPARSTQDVRPQVPEEYRDSGGGGGFRVPGIGLVLALLGTVVQVLSLTVLPWVAQGGDPRSLMQLWDALSDGQPRGFADWYLLLFSYPLVILGLLLTFAAVLESVAMKVVWAGLAIIGVGYLLLRYGLAPVTGMFGVDKHFTTRDVVVALAAVAAAVVVVFVLKSAVTMFRRVAGLVLIGLSVLHVVALSDLVGGFSSLHDLGIGAFGPVAGYLLTGVAALIGPRRFVPGA